MAVLHMSLPVPWRDRRFGADRAQERAVANRRADRRWSLEES